MRRIKRLALIVLSFLLLSACGSKSSYSVSISGDELPKANNDIIIRPLDKLARSSGKTELRFEVENAGDRAVTWDYRLNPLGISFVLLKYSDGGWVCKQLPPVIDGSLPPLNTPSEVTTVPSSVGLLPAGSKIFAIYPYDSVGRLGKGRYLICCFFSFEDEPDVVYGSYYEFEL